MQQIIRYKYKDCEYCVAYLYFRNIMIAGHLLVIVGLYNALLLLFEYKYKY